MEVVTDENKPRSQFNCLSAKQVLRSPAPAHTKLQIFTRKSVKINTKNLKTFLNQNYLMTILAKNEKRFKTKTFLRLAESFKASLIENRDFHVVEMKNSPSRPNADVIRTKECGQG